MALLSTEKILEYIPQLFESGISGEVDIFKKLEKLLIFDEGFIYYANPDSLQLKFSYKKHKNYPANIPFKINKNLKDEIFSTESMNVSEKILPEIIELLGELL